MERKITLDEVPSYSHWPSRLLGLTPFSQKTKTIESLTREFDDEKWGELLRKTLANPDLTLADIERLEVDFTDTIPMFRGGDFFATSEERSFHEHIRLGSEVLAPHMNGATALVEMGAGYGSKILNLAQQKPFLGVPLFAGEFAASGRQLISLLAEKLGLKIQVGPVNFADLGSAGMDIPEGAVFFTYYAAHYIPQLPPDFTDIFARYRPKAVIHFEPCYEHFTSISLHDLMCRRCFELNDYTRNLVSVLKQQEKMGRIQIISERPKVLGENPFLPVSVIEWKPLYK